MLPQGTSCCWWGWPAMKARATCKQHVKAAPMWPRSREGLAREPIGDPAAAEHSTRAPLGPTTVRPPGLQIDKCRQHDVFPSCWTLCDGGTPWRSREITDE